MPDTSVRISASSSTIRMSSVIARCWLAIDVHVGSIGRLTIDIDRVGAVFRNGDRCHRLPENERNPGAIAVPIIEQQISVMVLHDLLYDGETKAGTLGAGGHIRLGEAIPVLTGQTATVVFDVDCNYTLQIARRFLPHGHTDPARRQSIR